jgi:hypothetical protein
MLRSAKDAIIDFCLLGEHVVVCQQVKSSLEKSDMIFGRLVSQFLSIVQQPDTRASIMAE